MENIAADSKGSTSWFDSHSHIFGKVKPIELDDKAFMPGVYESGIGENWPPVEDMWQELGGEG